MTEIVDFHQSKRRIEAERYYEAHEYIPGGVVLMAMHWFDQSDPQSAWDILVRAVVKEAFSGDEEVCKEDALRLINS